MLLAGLPLLIVLVGLTTWKLVGRALAPMDAIRAEVDEISASEMHRRVPAPGGTDEVARLASTMNRMLDRLELAQRRQQQFVSDASHELRSPVASIREQAEVALAHPERVTTSDLAEHVLAEDLRVQRLVEDLLLLARADEQTLRLKRRPVDLDDLVFEVAQRLRAGSSLRIDTTDVSAARVLGDAPGLRRVVANLAENAARHARTRGRVLARGRPITRWCSPSTTTAPGSLRRIARGSSSASCASTIARARDAGGSGLGLAIVAQLVGAHGGTVAIVDGTGGGTRVEVRLDAAPSPN